MLHDSIVTISAISPSHSVSVSRNLYPGTAVWCMTRFTQPCQKQTTSKSLICEQTDAVEPRIKPLCLISPYRNPSMWRIRVLTFSQCQNLCVCTYKQAVPSVHAYGLTGCWHVFFQGFLTAHTLVSHVQYRCWREKAKHEAHHIPICCPLKNWSVMKY